jgi:hypothetical protein
MPSPSLLINYFKEGVSDKAYADRDAYLDHLIELMNEDALRRTAAGWRFAQRRAPRDVPAMES